MSKKRGKSNVKINTHVISNNARSLHVGSRLRKSSPNFYTSRSPQTVFSQRTRARAIIRDDVRDLARVATRNLPRRAAYVARRILDDPARVLKHDCRKEYSKLLSWRASRSGGSKRRRSNKELRNNRRDFKRKDC